MLCLPYYLILVHAEKCCSIKHYYFIVSRLYVIGAMLIITACSVKSSDHSEGPVLPERIFQGCLNTSRVECYTEVLQIITCNHLEVLNVLVGKHLN